MGQRQTERLMLILAPTLIVAGGVLLLTGNNLEAGRSISWGAWCVGAISLGMAMIAWVLWHR